MCPMHINRHAYIPLTTITYHKIIILILNITYTQHVPF